MAPLRRLALIAVASLGAVGCGNGDGDRPQAATTEQPARSGTTTPATSDASPSTATGGTAFTTTEHTATGQGYGLLKQVRAARQPDGTERVVFEFEGTVPGHRIGFIERPVREDGSGDEVQVEGAAVLGVHFEPASGVDLSGPEMRMVYKGPRRLDLATSTVVDVVRVTDFEANLDWAIGLDSRVGFKVTVLGDPGRIVVDVEPSPGASR